MYGLLFLSYIYALTLSDYLLTGLLMEKGILRKTNKKED